MWRKYVDVRHHEEPGAVIPHAGICEGAVQVTGRPTSTGMGGTPIENFLDFAPLERNAYDEQEGVCLRPKHF